MVGVFVIVGVTGVRVAVGGKGEGGWVVVDVGVGVEDGLKKAQAAIIQPVKVSVRMRFIPVLPPNSQNQTFIIHQNIEERQHEFFIELWIYSAALFLDTCSECVSIWTIKIMLILYQVVVI